MPTSPERAVMPDSEIINKSGQEVDAAVAGGTSVGQLVAETVAKLKQTEDVANEIKREINSRTETIPETQKDNSKLILENIAKAFKLATIATPATINANSLDVLQRLNAELGGNISQKSAVRLHGLVKDAMSGPITIDQLTAHYADLVNSGDTTLVPKVSRVMVQVATTRYGLSADEAQRRFSPDMPTHSAAAVESSPHAIQGVIESLRSRTERIDWTSLVINQADYDLVRNFMDNPRGFTGDMNNLVTALSTNGLGSAGEVRRFIADMKSVTNEQWESYAMATLRDQMSLDEEERAILDKYFTKEENFFAKNFFTRNAAGEFVFTSDKVAEYKLGVLRIFNKLYQRVDQQPDRLFREEFNDFHEGLAFRILKRHLESLSNKHNMRGVKVKYIHPDSPPGAPVVTEGTFKDFINDFLSEIAAENTWRETYHDMWIYAKDTENLPKLPSFLSRLPLSQVNIFLSGPGGELVETARAAFERYLSYDIATNDNKARADLLSGMFDPASQSYQLTDYNNVKAYFKEMLVARGIDPTDSRYAWQIDRALTMARGIALINTLRVPEIIASAIPEGGYVGNFLYDLAAYVNPQWAWSWGRGGPATAHGLELPVLRLIDVPITPEKSLVKRVLGLAGRHVPKQIHDKLEARVEGEVREFGSAWLDRQHEYGKLLRIFGLGGAHARAGWRYTGIKELRSDPMVINMVNSLRRAAGKPDLTAEQFKKPDYDDEWFNDYLIRVIGAAEGWYFAGHRAQHDLKDLFGEAMHHHGHIKKPWDQLSEDEQNALWNEYTMGEEDVELDAFGQKRSLWQLADMREMQYKGDTFYNLLKRSPLDFIINMTQLVPEVEGIKSGMDGLSYWFATDLSKLPTDTDKANVREFQHRMKEKWGDHYDSIKRVAQMWSEVRSAYRAHVGANLTEEEIAVLFRNTMSDATEKVRKRHDVAMQAGDITHSNAALATKLQDLMFGTNGFVTYYKAAGDAHYHNLYDGTHHDRVKRAMDEDNFFFRLANVWFKEDQVGVFPTSAEVDHRYLFKYINRAGDNMNKRLVGDWPSWKSAMEGVLKLDEMLLKAANSHDLKEIMELHHKLTALRYINGKRFMHQANYYVAALVGRYFQEHYAARLPFGLGILGGFAMGKEIALSKLSPAGKTAMTMNSDQLRSYFETLGKMGAIDAENGPWSVNQISQAIGVDMEKLWITEILPNFSTFLIAYILWRWLKEAEKESQGGGGGGGGGHH